MEVMLTEENSNELRAYVYQIVIEEITFKFYLNTFLDYFRIRRKIPTDYKSKADKI